MKKRVLSILLALVLVASLVQIMTPVRAEFKPTPTTSHYFYDQLNDRAQSIYNALYEAFTGKEKAQYYDGTKSIDLVALNVITREDVLSYQAGNKDIFNDFCAAKDALDLDHSELWYIDSGYLSFRATEENGAYHVYIGPGRGKTYLLGGKEINGVSGMIDKADTTIKAICDSAVKQLNTADPTGSYSAADRTAALVTYVHDQITKGIHYRYEIECSNSENARYIRTIYGMVTHEGVCEAYSRTLQVCLTRLGIECVLVHGVQTKGTPEDHMWNAVNIPNGNEDRWYVVDATWDDPLTANWDGTRDLKFNNGEDGKETNTYLLVGQSLVGEHWRPSGYVSTGNFEFTYPTIETASYSGATVHGDNNGLKIDYSTGGTVDGAPAGVFSVTYKGMNAAQARANGYYFMVKMYDYHADGTADVMQEWYYADATFILSEGNPYFGDYGGALRIYTPTCEYVEIAVTTREPDQRNKWSTNASTSYLSSHPEAGYFHGDESEIVAQSGMLYNVNSKYEAPPYVLSQYPAPNGNATAGYNYRFKVIYDDDLYHILPRNAGGETEIATVAEVSGDFADNSKEAENQTVQVRYTTNQQDLHNGGAVVTTQVSGELPFDEDRDGIVDMNGSNKYVDFKWIYKSDTGVACPNTAYHAGGNKACSVEKGCPIVGVEFNFRASDMWIDDVTEYNFSIEGVVGSKSAKFPNNFSVIATVPGLCPACYRSQGIDWNLWGQPTLLDAPENLDLYNMAVSGGTDPETLKKLNAEMNRDDLNGRLMLVVEDKSQGAGNRVEYEKINDALPNEEKEAIEKSAKVFSSVFEINFNRVCPMVKLKPNNGESLRVQVGYPAGITYETLSQYDLKAFHFTRCSNDPEYYCDEVKEALNNAKSYERAEILQTHAWGEHIIRTEQIELIPTPYGIVIMCSAFSPFEIVATEKTSGISAIANEPKTVVVVSDGNGKVMVDGQEAVGEAGNVKLDTTKTFTVVPDDGYVLESAALGGTALTVEDNTFKLNGADLDRQTDVLSVTFVPAQVKSENEVAIVSKACTHPSTEKIIEADKKEAPATCTADGYAFGTRCTVCKTQLTYGHVIPATGHTVKIETPEKPATCTTAGTRAVAVCSKPECGAKLSDGEEIPALGHSFTKYEDVKGSATCQDIRKVATCDRKDCNEQDERLDSAGGVDHSYTEVLSQAATCTQNAVKTLQCQWCSAQKTEEQPNTAKGHTPSDNGDGTCATCGAFICANGHDFQPTPAKAPTCTENGHTAGSKCTVCGLWQTPETLLLATGHDFDGDTAGSKCKNCDQRMTSDTHTPESMADVPATCESQGTTGGKKCSGCGQILEKPTIVPALGHDWSLSSPTWHWSTEGELSASVTLKCNRCNHSEAFAATLKQDSVTTPASCTATGKATYTATATVNGKTLTTKSEVVLPMTEHTLGEPTKKTETTCTHHGTETYVCSVCNKEIVKTLEGDLKPHSIEVPSAQSTFPTCTEGGKLYGLCTVCHENVEQEVPALGHSFVNGKCTVCGASQSSGGYIPPIKPAEPTTPAAPVEFPDIPANAWYAEAVAKVTERGLILGDQNGNFNPEQKTGRGQLMTILARLSGVDTTGSDPWYKAGMDWAVAAGISDGNDPLNDLPREQFVTMLYRYRKSPAVTGDLSAYPDAGKVNDWAYDAMVWAIENGLVTGTDRGTLEPGEVANRAVAATILSRFLDKFDL